VRPECSASARSTFRPSLEVLEDRCLLAAGYALTNLASDIPGQAPVTDTNLVNPWGISFSPTGAFWLAENGTGVSDLLDGSGLPQPLVVTALGANGSAGTPTGTVFNGGRGFDVSRAGTSGPSLFLFATEDGTISGWNPFVDPTHALLAVDNSASLAVYKGLALAADSAGQSFLDAANFHSGTIDVFDQHFQPVSRAGAFQDPAIPHGYAPFNIQNINGLLFVTYAQQNQDRHDDVPGEGHGFLDVYTPDGAFVRRLVSAGPLSSPWGLALAPAGFGELSGTLLVGNTGDGRINAFDPASGAFLGQLTTTTGSPLTINNLWGLAFGNGHQAAPSNVLFFTAGVDHEEHGLFGAIRDPSVPVVAATATVPYDPSNPDDQYPLPPDNGPVLASLSAAVPSAPISVLVELTDSSLVLAPTLFSVPQFTARATFAGSDRPNLLVEPSAPVGSPASENAVPLFSSASISVMTPFVVGPVHTGSPERTGLIPLSTLLDVVALEPGRQATLAQPTDSSRSPVAACGTDASVIAATQSPVFGPVAAERVAPPVKDEVGLATAQAQREPSERDFQKVLLGKLFLASIAALALYYLPGDKAGDNESMEPPDPGANKRLP
jgi:uncharacterized protein (TIGR03118 family)